MTDGTGGTGSGFAGHAVSWVSLGRTVVEEIEVGPPGPDDLTVEVVASVVSAGTERARYLGLPNADVEFPHRPGYAAAGVVRAAGGDADKFSPGDSVALLDTPHQGIVTVPAARAYPVPRQVEPADAAVLQIGVIAAQGVHRAEVEPGEPLAVVGAGLIGALACQVARAEGAGAVTLVAASGAKRRVAALAGADRFLTTTADGDAVAGLGLGAVIDASGTPEGLLTAIAAARPGGRVVVLGSQRVPSSRFPLATIHQKRLRVLGAHVLRLSRAGEWPGRDALREESERFLVLLAGGGVRLGGLVEDVDPAEADRLYRRLVGDRAVVGARFDWARSSLGPPIPLAGGRRPRGGPGGTGPRDTADAASGAVADQPAARGEGGRDPHRAHGERTGATYRPALGDPLGDAAGDLRIGVVGCGEIAVLDADAIAQAPNARVVACHDTDAALAADLAGRQGADAVAGLDELLGREDVDAVLVCVPHHLHEPVALRALAAGKHVVVEKPLAVDLAAGARMVAAAEAAGRALSICFPQRYDPSVRAARDLIAAGAVGRITQVELRWFADKPVSYWFGGFSGRVKSTWRMRREEAGGGVLLMNLCHGLDLLRYLMAAAGRPVEVESVLALTGNADGIADVEDGVVTCVRFDNQAIGSLVGSAAARGTREEGLTLWGAEGHVALRPLGERQAAVHTIRALPGLVPGRRAEVEAPAGPAGRTVYFSRLATALARGEPPEVRASDGLVAQAVVEAAYQAARTGTLVRPAALLDAASREASPHDAAPHEAGAC